MQNLHANVHHYAKLVCRHAKICKNSNQVKSEGLTGLLNEKIR